MAAPSYLFYDIETTGLNCCFDQILQFAAIRTDLDLNEIERHNIRVRLRDDITPSPYALITHRISLKDMQDDECLCEYDAIKKIHDIINQPATTSLGYNTLGFDDEFLRFAFHRNLLTPYTHQYSNHCSRMDIYPITIINYLFGNNHIDWPMIDNKVSLKLENLNHQNQWVKGQAHDALVDVEITLALARQLRQNEDMWNYLLGYFNKPTDLQRIAQCPIVIESNNRQFRKALLVMGKLGFTKNFQAPVLHLGTHQHYKNQILFLRLDLPELRNVTADTIDQHCYVIRKKVAEKEIILPPHERFMKQLDASRTEEMNKNIQWLQDNLDLLFKITQYYQAFQYEKVPNLDIDAALYEFEFPTKQQLTQFERFHQAEIQQKPQVVEQFHCAKRKQQALRILQRNFAAQLQLEHDSTPIDSVDYRGQKHYDMVQALEDIDKIKKEKTLDKEQLQLLDEFLTTIQASTLDI